MERGKDQREKEKEKEKTAFLVFGSQPVLYLACQIVSIESVATSKRKESKGENGRKIPAQILLPTCLDNMSPNMLLVLLPLPAALMRNCILSRLGNHPVFELSLLHDSLCALRGALCTTAAADALERVASDCYRCGCSGRSWVGSVRVKDASWGGRRR